MRSTVWRNLIWLGSTSFGGMVASAVYGLLAARYLGPLNFGRFALVVGIGSWLISIAQGGGTAALLLLAAQDHRQAGQLLWPGIIIQASVGAIAILVALPVVWILGHDTSLLWPSLLYGSANIAYLTMSVPLSIFRGLDQMEWGVALVASGLGIVLLMGGVVIFDLGLDATIAANTISQFLVLIIVLPLACRSLSKYSIGWNPQLTSRLWASSIALWGVTIVQSLHWRVGLVAVQVMAGSYELGIYTAAAKLVENLRIIPWFMLMAVLPTFARVGHTSQDELGLLLQRAVRYALLVAFPLCATLVVLSPVIMGVLYPSQYEPSLQVFKISAFGLVPLFIFWVFMNAMISLHMERKLIAIYCLSILAEAVLDVWLIPAWGVRGAAVGYVVGESLAALIGGLYLARVLGRVGGKALLRIAVPGLLALVLVWLPLANADLFVWAVVICLLYLVCVFLLKGITFAELRSVIGHRSVAASSD